MRAGGEIGENGENFYVYSIVGYSNYGFNLGGRRFSGQLQSCCRDNLCNYQPTKRGNSNIVNLSIEKSS
jgi:hypothetical protein